jgi:hypothetical protein
MLALGKRNLNKIVHSGAVVSAVGFGWLSPKFYTTALGCWLLVLGPFRRAQKNQQPIAKSCPSIDVVRNAPYNERNQEFGESRWTLNRPAICLKPIFP